MDNKLRQYVNLIEGAEHEEFEEDYLESEDEELLDDELEEGDAEDRVKEVLEEDNTFWENFEEDSDFEIEENNGMYCVRGVDTEFHYGSHVSYDCAADHVESLKDYTI